jgi:hypothetical protein
MTKKLLVCFASVLFFFGIILVFTHGLFDNYFEQDEWGAIGSAIHSFSLPWWNIFITRGFHFSPLGYILWDLLYKFFGLQAGYYTFIQLLMHAIASYLVFLLASKLSNDKKIGLLTGILFATNSRAYQAYMHLAINTSVGVFLCIVLFFVYLSRIKNKYFTLQNAVILFLIFLAAVGIREEGVMIVPMFAVYIWLFDASKINKKNVKPLFVMATGLFVFLLLRYISQKFNTTFIPVGLRVTFGSVIYNLISLPVKLVVQNIFSGVTIFKFLVANGHQLYSDTQISVLDTYPVFMDLTFVSIFCIMLVFFSLWHFYLGNKKYIKIIIFSIFWILCNAFILSFVGRRLYIVEERYLYFSSFPVLFVFSIIVCSLYRTRSRIVVVNIVTKIVSALCVIFLLTFSYQEIQSAVQSKAFVGKARKSLMNSVLDVHPTIQNNTIFYIQCKGVCHKNELFGLSSEWVMPFSSGAGWNMLVLYATKQENIWGKFLTDDFLLNLNSQGYKKIGNDSFGYFTDISLMRQTLKEYNYDSDIVLALEYNEDSFTVRDISTTIRQELNEK